MPIKLALATGALVRPGCSGGVVFTVKMLQKWSTRRSMRRNTRRSTKRSTRRGIGRSTTRRTRGLLATGAEYVADGVVYWSMRSYLATICCVCISLSSCSVRHTEFHLVLTCFLRAAVAGSDGDSDGNS